MTPTTNSAPPLSPTTTRAPLIDASMLAWALIALAVVLPGSGWGIPQATHPLVVRGWEVDGVGGMSLLSELANLKGPSQPDWYVAYPLFHYLVLSVACAPVLLMMLATGQVSSPGGAFPYGFQDPVGSIALLSGVGHAVSMIMAAGVVVSVFVLARRLFDQRAAHFAAAATLACAPFLFYARTSNLDVPVLFWVMLTFLAVERALTIGPSFRRVAWCGVTAALAVATKDQAFGLVVIPLLYVAYRSRHVVNDPVMRRTVLTLLLSGAITFAVASGLMFRPDRFLKHMRYITHFEDTFANVRIPTFLTVIRDSTPAGLLDLLRDFAAATGAAIGWPALCAGLIGWTLVWRRTPATRWLLLSCAGLFALVILPIHHMQYRYALTPSIIAALGVAAFVYAITTRWPQHHRLVQAMGALVVLSTMRGGLEVTHAMRSDARWEAGQWLSTHVQSGDTVSYFGKPHQLPYLPADVEIDVLGERAPAAEDVQLTRPEWIVVVPDYFADMSREHSIFLPDSLYHRLLNGDEGYERVARFVTPPLFNRPLPYLPYVNPMVQVFQRVPHRVTND